MLEADAEEEPGTVDVLDGVPHGPRADHHRVEGVPEEGQHWTVRESSVPEPGPSQRSQALESNVRNPLDYQSSDVGVLR